MNEIFGKRLKELRREHNVTQVQLSEACNISQASIAQWENGAKTPNINFAVSLAKYFNCSIEYLLGLTD